MPARALLVLLVMLNAGVATWWLLRPAPPAPAPWVPPADVPRLQLLGEGPGAAATVEPVAGGAGAEVDPAERTAAADALAQPAGEGVAAPRCHSFGPFVDAGSVAAAYAAVQPLGATGMRAREVVQAPRGWRVVVAPQPDRAAADALAAKIREAGFDDLLVVPSGDDANAIALGRYASEPSARQRESTLRAAGFQAQAQPLGEVAVSRWLDVAAGPAFDAAAARAASAAAQARDIDCTGVEPADAAR